ncbi:MAG: oligosaccharide flippase family protein [Planctomycetota bacterium]
MLETAEQTCVERTSATLEATPHRRVIADSAKFLLATLAAQGNGLIRTVGLAVLLNPVQLGVWNLMNIIATYGNYISLGLLPGLNNSIPLMRGKGELERAEKAKDSVFWSNNILALAALVLVWGCSWIVSENYASGLRVVSFSIAGQAFYFFYFLLLRADVRYGLISKGVAGQATLMTIGVLGLAYLCEDRVKGALIGLALSYFLINIYWFKLGAYTFKRRVEWPIIRETFWIGLPLVICGITATLLLSIDRWVIVSQFDGKTLGFYALAIMINGMLSSVPASVANVLYPRLLERFGATNDPKASVSLLLAPLRLSALLVVFLIAGGVLLLPPVIRFVLPKYIPSLALIEILVPGGFFLSLTFISGNALLSFDRLKLFFAIQLCAAAAALLAMLALVKAGLGIRGVALGTVLGYAVYGLGYTISAVYLSLGNKLAAGKFMGKLLLPFLALLPGLVCASFLSHALDSRSAQLSVSVLNAALFAVMLAPAVWVSNRDGELWALVRAEIARRFSKRT